MVVELPEELETALKQKALTRGVSPAGYVREVLHRDLATNVDAAIEVKPFKNSYGLLAKYGPAPSAEEIDENRKDMFRNFGETF